MSFTTDPSTRGASRSGASGALASERSRKALFALLVGPLAGAEAIALRGEPPYDAAALVFVAFASGALMVPRTAHWERFLPLMGRVLPAGGVLGGLPLLVAIQAATGAPDITALELAEVSLIVALVSAVPEALLARRWMPPRPLRVAVIGPSRCAELLAAELSRSDIRSHLLVGVVASAPDQGHPPQAAAGLARLGSIAQLDALVEEHAIDLLVMADQDGRARILDEVVRSCLHLPVRLTQLSNFYEEMFGHVPLAEMSSAWFEYMLHPRYRGGGSVSKRVLDVTAGMLLALVSALPLLVLGLMIRRDGGPALFRQTRIGEGGRPFTLYKLRTMRQREHASAEWASSEDPRVTRIGHFLRRTHLDELPQALNVIRGDMSLIGPRPEQPEFVERLDAIVPFYARRHLIRPGLTGWAQVLCGYAGSDVGSSWKLCHDLYYLKHRSLVFDLVILAETARKLFADPHCNSEPSSTYFVLPAAPSRPLAAAEAA